MPVDSNKEFPIELLNASIDERKQYFYNYTVFHRILKNTVNNVVSILNSPNKERIIFVCGPSGVGKKELIKLLEAEVNKSVSRVLCPGCIPVVSVEAQSPDKGGFNYPLLWESILIKMNEPLLNHKITYQDEKIVNEDGRAIILSKIKKAKYQDVLNNAFKYREVKALIINEAHHMLRVTGSQRLSWSVDLLKTLTNCSQTPVILVGTYELLTFLEDLYKGITD